jgi:hypothetical protein
MTQTVTGLVSPFCETLCNDPFEVNERSRLARDTRKRSLRYKALNHGNNEVARHSLSNRLVIGVDATR